LLDVARDVDEGPASGHLEPEFLAKTFHGYLRVGCPYVPAAPS
jgi:hypothetical protein